MAADSALEAPPPPARANDVQPARTRAPGGGAGLRARGARMRCGPEAARTREGAVPRSDRPEPRGGAAVPPPPHMAPPAGAAGAGGSVRFGAGRVGSVRGGEVHSLQPRVGLQRIAAWCNVSPLSGRRQGAELKGSLSTWRPVTSGVPPGADTLLISIGDMDSGIEFTLIKIAGDTKLCGAVNTLEGKDAIPRDLDRLERWHLVNLTDSIRPSARPYTWFSPRHTYRLRGQVIGSSPAEKDLGDDG